MVKHFEAVSKTNWLFILLGCFLAIVDIHGQNLVLNGDFEQAFKDPCLFIPSPKENLRDYFSNWLSPTGGTSDPWFYSDTIVTGCTQNLKTFPITAHSGKRCAGVYMSSNKYRSPTKDTVYREYLQTKLRLPLQKGKVYSVELYCRRNPYSGTNSNNLGFYFSINPISTPITYSGRLNVIPQVSNKQLIEADLDWVKITGCFIALDAYEYVTIGNFYDDAHTLMQIAPLPNHDERPYYLIDDVVVKEASVQQLPLANFLGPDTTLCPMQTLTLTLPRITDVNYYLPDGTQITNYNISQTGTFRVEAKAGECVIEDTIKVNVERAIHLPPDTTVCMGEKISLTLDHADNRYQWSDGSHDSTLMVNQTGRYWVGIPSPYCKLSDTVQVNIIDCSLFIPNVITPNGDGINDHFVVKSNVDVNYNWQLEITNRWGARIYKSLNYKNDWAADGSPAGVYYYLLVDSIHHARYKGWITVLR